MRSALAHGRRLGQAVALLALLMAPGCGREVISTEAQAADPLAQENDSQVLAAAERLVPIADEFAEILDYLPEHLRPEADVMARERIGRSRSFITRLSRKRADIHVGMTVAELVKRLGEPDRKEPFGWAVPTAKWIYKDTFMLYGMPIRDVQAQLAGKRGRKRRKAKAPDVDSLAGDTVIVYDKRIEIPPEQLISCKLVVIIQNGRIQTWHEL